MVVSRFNPQITNRLLKGALSVLKKEGVPSRHIQVVKVPGAFEIPGVAMRMGEVGGVDALICLGAVIRGETAHFDYICSEVARGIGQVALTLGLPVIFGVLTTETKQQAKARVSGRINKGADAANVAIEMGLLYRQFRTRGENG